MNTFDNQKDNFFSFLKNIDETDKIGIIAHGTCNDGLISSIFLNEILKDKFPKMFKPFLVFSDYDLDIFEKISKEFKINKINKVFVLDMSINSEIVESFEQFCKEFDVCYIDHHPSDFEIKFLKNIIKTESADCTSLNLYKLGQPFLNKPYFNELLCAALVSEFSYNKFNNMKILQEFHPEITLENINYSEPFKLSNVLGSVVIYYKNNSFKSYELVLNKKISEIDEIHKIISREVEKNIKNFDKLNSNLDECVLFYETSSIFSLDSIISTILSVRNDSKIIVVYSISNSNPELINVSARCQIKSLLYSMSDLLKAGIYGFNSSTAGGHFRASGCSFLKKDLEIFKKQVISYVKSRAN